MKKRNRCRENKGKIGEKEEDKRVINRRKKKKRGRR